MSAHPATRDRVHSPAPRNAEAAQTASTVDPTATEADSRDFSPGTGAAHWRPSTSPDRYVAPAVGPSDLAQLPGPFGAPQLSRIDEALTLGTRETGLLFSVYVGTLQEPARRTAEELAARLPTEEMGGVLVAVSPGQRVLHIVTTGTAVSRLPNRTCALAALGMR
ncbi:MAG: DUF5130 domain-containing protein, partial [Actinomycetota bacterium]|nr:DUF5130 domain-containing protein [Actinomycetota bacterium]